MTDAEVNARVARALGVVCGEWPEHDPVQRDHFGPAGEWNPTRSCRRCRLQMGALIGAKKPVKGQKSFRDEGDEYYGPCRVDPPDYLHAPDDSREAVQMAAWWLRPEERSITHTCGLFICCNRLTDHASEADTLAAALARAIAGEGAE